MYQLTSPNGIRAASLPFSNQLAWDLEGLAKVLTPLLASVAELKANSATKFGVQGETYIYAKDTGVADAYAITLTPIPRLGEGSVAVLKVANTNTGASTLTVNNGRAIPVKKNGATDLAAGDWPAGLEAVVIYDGTNWQWIGGATGGGGGGTFPITFPATLHQFLNSYDSVTGLFTALQPDAADITGLAPSATIDTTNAANITSGLLAVARGGTGTATPALIAGTGISITGTWPAQTINATGFTPAFADDETPGGTQNGINQVFTLANAPSPAGSLQLFLQGVLQLRGTDYTLAGATITYTTYAPLVGDLQRVWYRH